MGILNPKYENALYYGTLNGVLVGALGLAVSYQVIQLLHPATRKEKKNEQRWLIGALTLLTFYSGYTIACRAALSGYEAGQNSKIEAQPPVTPSARGRHHHDRSPSFFSVLSSVLRVLSAASDSHSQSPTQGRAV